MIEMRVKKKHMVVHSLFQPSDCGFKWLCGSLVGGNTCKDGNFVLKNHRFSLKRELPSLLQFLHLFYWFFLSNFKNFLNSGSRWHFIKYVTFSNVTFIHCQQCIFNNNEKLLKKSNYNYVKFSNQLIDDDSKNGEGMEKEF